MPGLALAWATYTPTYSSWKLQGSIRDDPRFLWAAAGVWAVSGIYIIFLRLISHANPCTKLSFSLQNSLTSTPTLHYAIYARQAQKRGRFQGDLALTLYHAQIICGKSSVGR